MNKFRINMNALPASMREHIAGLVDLAHEALFSSCDVAASRAYASLKELSDPQDAAQLWNVHYCPQGRLSLDFIHHTSGKDYDFCRVYVGDVRDEHRHKIKGERNLFVGKT